MLATPERLEVTVSQDGTVNITADPLTAARLAGRARFGYVTPTRRALEVAIAEAWYAADCPPGTLTPYCVVCDDRGCEHCPAVTGVMR